MFLMNVGILDVVPPAAVENVAAHRIPTIIW